MAAVSLTLAALGAGSASAANPSWNVTFQKLPAVVKAGNDAGWSVTVKNNGPSNINELNVSIDSTSTTAASSYLSDLVLSTGGTESCSTASGVTTCNVGTLPAQATVTFTVAFQVPEGYAGSTFNLTIGLRAGTGDTPSDGGGNSRGDSIMFSSNVQVSSSANFDGGFVVDESVYGTTGDLRRQNKQNSTVEVSDTLLPVTVADGGTVSGSCTIDECAGAFGEWTGIDIPSHDGLIKVTLFVWGGAVPGGVSADEIYVLHDPDGPAAAYVISTACDPATGTPTNAECLTATKVGGNWRIVVWLEDNGSLRGGF